MLVMMTDAFLYSLIFQDMSAYDCPLSLKLHQEISASPLDMQLRVLCDRQEV